MNAAKAVMLMQEMVRACEAETRMEVRLAKGEGNAMYDVLKLTELREARNKAVQRYWAEAGTSAR